MAWSSIARTIERRHDGQIDFEEPEWRVSTSCMIATAVRSGGLEATTARPGVDPPKSLFGH